MDMEDDDYGGLDPHWEFEMFAYYFNEADLELQERAAPFRQEWDEYVRLCETVH